MTYFTQTSLPCPLTPGPGGGTVGGPWEDVGVWEDQGRKHRRGMVDRHQLYSG